MVSSPGTTLIAAAAPAHTSFDSVPTFGFVPRLVPKSGLLWSSLVHACFIAAISLSLSPQDAPTHLRAETVIEIPAHVPLAFARLPGVSSSGGAGSAQLSAKSTRAAHQSTNPPGSSSAGAL